MSICATEIPGKIISAFIPVALFVICGFEHSIANMYYIPAGLFIKYSNLYPQITQSAFSSLTIFNFFIKNLLPVTLGNALGGILFSYIMYFSHKQK